jgi:hypothetical protein
MDTFLQGQPGPNHLRAVRLEAGTGPARALLKDSSQAHMKSNARLHRQLVSWRTSCAVMVQNLPVRLAGHPVGLRRQCMIYANSGCPVLLAQRHAQHYHKCR